ncbi:MAG: glutamine cyclotransferase [Capsulimonadaceae bacterium]
MKTSQAEIVRDYGPFAGVERVNGVTYDGQNVWFAAGEKLHALDPASGETLRSLDVAAHAGSAFDGRYLYQMSNDRIDKIDPDTGAILASIPAPDSDGGNSGLAWAEGSLWAGHYRGRKIHQIDPDTGAILRTIESNRFVTGVTWVDGELWHGTWDDQSDIRRIDPGTGDVLEVLEMPEGAGVSGLESDGADRFFCGSGGTGLVRAVRRPSRSEVAVSV